MSISSSLSSALSGLNAASRAAELVSSNIANALTEGYGRRELELGARRVGNSGQGVQIEAVTRVVNQILIGDRRIASAGAAGQEVRAGFFQGLERATGTPGEVGSLTDRIAAFDASLLAAAAQPENTAQLNSLRDTAAALTGSLVSMSGSIQTMREDADTQIGNLVDRANTALSQVQEINSRIVQQTASGRDISALLDQRQQLIDTVAEIIPLREIARENGGVSLFAVGGAMLLEGKAAVIGFSTVGEITADMTQASGALSGLTLNGVAINSSGTGQIRGGTLAAQFAIRDTWAPAAQGQLDALALDLVQRFEDPALDSTRASGSAGLFTVSGAAFVPGDEVGLAGRLRLNAAVDPDQGGALWRLRDGLGAAVPGPSGQSALLSALHDALTETRSAPSNFLPGSRDFASLGGQMVSGFAANRLAAEGEASFAKAQATALQSLEAEGGIDTDRELQDLLVIEKAYAANAKVMQTVDDMLELLLGL